MCSSDLDNGGAEEEERPEPEVRVFTLLWHALTNWMTHDTVRWAKSLRDSHENSKHEDHNTLSVDIEWTPIVDRTDIGASRCAGVLAMIRLYLGGCMEELNHPPEERRRAVKRLNDIMRTFDYTQENPKLEASHWKVMTCILLDAVLIETRDDPILMTPPSVAAVGMTVDEFEYLSRKAVLTFDHVERGSN